MHQLAQPALHAEKQTNMCFHIKKNAKCASGVTRELTVPALGEKSNQNRADDEPGEADESQGDPAEHQRTECGGLGIKHETFSIHVKAVDASRTRTTWSLHSVWTLLKKNAFFKQQSFSRTSRASQDVRAITLLIGTQCFYLKQQGIYGVNINSLINPINSNSLSEPWRNTSLRDVSASNWPEGEEHTVAHEHAHAPEDGEAEADVAEVLIGSGQEVPRGQLLGGEALRHLVVHDALQALLVEVEGVAQRELPLRLGLRAPQLAHFLLHGASLTLDDPWDTVATRLVDGRSALYKDFWH